MSELLSGWNGKYILAGGGYRATEAQ